MGMCKKNSLLSICFVVRRVVVLRIARGRLNIRFGHCTSCLFDNSSVKLCKHDTPNNKTHVIKFRVTAEEKASLELTCKLLNLSLSTFIRRAIHNVKIEKTVIVAGGGEETLTAVSTLLAQCSKVGGNLNQLARHFNSGGADTEQIRAKLLDELADLTAFRLHAEKVLGELYGNAQAYRL